jgi:16S rRNA (adenine1518-N6/adenine1519-N6)-dimethyltransferase
VTELLGPAEIRALADRLGVRPTKRRGQNFVHDPNTVRRIVGTAALAPADVVLEVGPGLGSLTLGLLPVAAHVHAVEIDPVLAAALPATIAARAAAHASRLTVHQLDALKLASAPAPAPTALVANLPYNVAVPVILHLLGVLPALRHGLVMVQQEVADRLTAPPGSKVYGAPTVKLAWFASARPAGRVPRTVFWPVPNVDSGLVAITRRPAPGDDRPAGRRMVFEVVDAAFGQRRKTLRAALAGWASGADQAAAILAAAGVAAGDRAESLTIEQFTAIATAGAPSRGSRQ